LQHFLHKPVSFFILPLFAIANTAIAIPGNWIEGLAQASSIGIIAGLVIGKPLGISLFSFAAVRTGLCQLPSQVNWKSIVGAGVLAGIGFTMSIFITMLAFEEEAIINNAKIAILTGSVISGIAGLLWLRLTLRKQGGMPAGRLSS
jgi:NhaA family Na+:H+ antiporter